MKVSNLNVNIKSVGDQTTVTITGSVVEPNQFFSNFSFNFGKGVSEYRLDNESKILSGLTRLERPARQKEIRRNIMLGVCEAVRLILENKR